MGVVNKRWELGSVKGWTLGIPGNLITPTSLTREAWVLKWDWRT